MTEIGELAGNDYAGVHLDFEYLPPDDAPKLAVFLRELRLPLNGNLADLETRKRMKDLAGSYGLKGIALWRLGFEER